MTYMELWVRGVGNKIASFFAAPPIDFHHGCVLLIPKRRNVRVRQEDQAQVAKDGFGKVNHQVGRGIPRQEDAGFGSTPRVSAAGTGHPSYSF